MNVDIVADMHRNALQNLLKFIWSIHSQSLQINEPLTDSGAL